MCDGWREVRNAELDTWIAETAESRKTLEERLEWFWALEVPLRRTGMTSSALCAAPFISRLTQFRHVKRVRRPTACHLRESAEVVLPESVAPFFRAESSTGSFSASEVSHVMIGLESEVRVLLEAAAAELGELARAAADSAEEKARAPSSTSSSSPPSSSPASSSASTPSAPSAPTAPALLGSGDAVSVGVKRSREGGRGRRGRRGVRGEEGEDAEGQKLGKALEQLLSAIGPSFRVLRVQIPKAPSLDIAEVSKEAKDYWPMFSYFHSDASAPVAPVPPLPAHENRRLRAGMDAAITQARLGRARGFLGVGCVIVDPNRLDGPDCIPGLGWLRGVAFAQEKMRKGHDGEFIHPYHTATMLAIEDVAAADRARSSFVPPLSSSSSFSSSSSSTSTSTSSSSSSSASSGPKFAVPTVTAITPQLWIARQRPPEMRTGFDPKVVGTGGEEETKGGAGEGGEDGGGSGGEGGGGEVEEEWADGVPGLPTYLFSGAAALSAARNHAPPVAPSPIPGLFLPPPKAGVLASSTSTPLPASAAATATAKTGADPSVTIPRTSQSASREPETYLCTGCDVFLTQEPGPMDAMALVHARVSRVFIGSSDPAGGALIHSIMLPRLEALNHRYRVWEAVPGSRIEQTCKELATPEPEEEGEGKE